MELVKAGNLLKQKRFHGSGMPYGKYSYLSLHKLETKVKTERKFGVHL